MEGAGKTTQLRAARAWLESRGTPLLTIREPGGTELGDQIRTILLTPSRETLTPMAELLLFSASRRQLVETVLRPALAQGTVVLCDRFSDSSIAYQGLGRGIPLTTVQQLVHLATDGLEPDLTILLDLPPELGLSRVAHRGEGQDDRFEAESLAFHQRVRQGFLELARAHPHRITIVDAARPVEEVTADVLELIDHGIRRHTGT